MKKKVKSIKTARYSLGVSIEQGDKTYASGRVKLYENNAFFINPINPENNTKELITVSLDVLYEDIKLAVHHYKDVPSSLNESISNLASKYGFLTFKTSSFLIDDEDPSVKKRIQNLWVSSYELDGFYEYQIWKDLITKFFPVHLPYLDSWVKLEKIKYSLTFLNSHMHDAKVAFSSLKMNNFEVTPVTLVSAIILYIKAKKHNKEPYLECKYEPCKTIVLNNFGKGREKKYCSDSCKSMAWRLNHKK